MRWWCVALLAANALWYAWALHARTQEDLARRAAPQAPAALPRGLPSLRLLSELDAPPPLRAVPALPPGEGGPAVAEAPAAAPVPEADETVVVIDTQAATPGSGVCTIAGPFLAVADAQPLRDWLRTRAVRLLLESREVRARQLYWIYLEPIDDATAQERLRDLRAQGVQDYLLIKRADMTSAISLGLFSSQDAVNRRLAELQEKGYQPVVVPRFETREEHWLRAELAQGYEDPALIPDDARGGVRLAPIPCAALLTGAAG